MASSVSGIVSSSDPFQNTSTSQESGSSDSKTRLSTTEQMKQMEASGQSADEISTLLGLPLAQVDADLGITSATTATAAKTISIKA